LPDLKLLVVAPVVTRVASALAGAIDEIAIAKPATKSNEAFIAICPPKSWDGKCPSRKIR
jgi:hypothetical protein